MINSCRYFEQVYKATENNTETGEENKQSVNIQHNLAIDGVVV